MRSRRSSVPPSSESPEGRGGSAPSIANVDADPEPEILVGVDQGIFVYDLGCDVDAPGPECARDSSPTTGLPALPRGARWADRPPRDAWDYMGATTFDFDADGDVEVVYADECFLRVYDGATGAVLHSHWRPSRTASEVPIVVGTGGGADTVIAIGLHTARFCDQATGAAGVPPYDPQFPGLTCASDRDCFGAAGCCRAGRCRCTTDAECCAPGTDCPSIGYACHPADDADGSTCRAVRIPDTSAHATFGALEEGIDVLTDAFGRWAPARSVWNQDAYAITNVQDDGTIPRTSAVVRSWSAAGGNTFRSNVSGGMRSTAAADLRVHIDGCGIEPMFEIWPTICNRGARTAPRGQSVRWSASGTVICETTTADAIPPGACERVTCALGTPAPVDDYLVEVAAERRLPECGGDESNSAIQPYGHCL